MSAPLVSTERRDDGVAVVRLENPKVNALSSEVLRQLRSAAEALTESPPGAVVVTGGDRVFAAGADIAEFAGPDEARLVGGLFLDALNAVAAIPRATIAAVSGFALGGGCELALACDFRLASSRARFGQPEILLGIIPDSLFSSLTSGDVLQTLLVALLIGFALQQMGPPATPILTASVFQIGGVVYQMPASSSIPRSFDGSARLNETGFPSFSEEPSQ